MFNNHLIIDRLDNGEYAYFAIGAMARKLQADIASLGHAYVIDFGRFIYERGCDEIAHYSVPEQIVKVMSRPYFNSLIKSYVEARK